MRFIDNDHRDFYDEQVERLNADCYLETFIYIIGICSDTRDHWAEIYDCQCKEIDLDQLYADWQTGSSVKVTRLAFHLFTDTTPTANQSKDFEECQKYSVSEIFCCEYAQYFMQAIAILYPEYFTDNWF